MYRRNNQQKEQGFANKNNQTKQNSETFFSPFVAMIGLICTLGAFEIWTIRYFLQ